MRAIVETKPGPGYLMFATDRPEPTRLADEMKLRMNAAGICGTGLEALLGEPVAVTVGAALERHGVRVSGLALAARRRRDEGCPEAEHGLSSL